MLLLFFFLILKFYKSQQQTLRCYLTAPRCGFVNTNSQLCPFTIFLVGWDTSRTVSSNSWEYSSNSNKQAWLPHSRKPRASKSQSHPQVNSFYSLRRVSKESSGCPKEQGASNFSLKYSEKLPLTKTKRLSEYKQLIYDRPPKKYFLNTFSSYHTSQATGQVKLIKINLILSLFYQIDIWSTGLNSQITWFRLLLEHNFASLSLSFWICSVPIPQPLVQSRSNCKQWCPRAPWSETWGIRSATQYQTPGKWGEQGMGTGVPQMPISYH